MRNIVTALLLLATLALTQPTYAQRFRRPYTPPLQPTYAPQPAPAAEVLPKEVKAAPPSIPKNVPDAARHEVERRGNLVQSVGTPQAGDNDYIADAFSIPEDDTHKWYLTLVTMEGCKACEKLKYDIATSKVFQSWVHVDDEVSSPMHYQVRRIEDATTTNGSQKDWYNGIRKELKDGGYPAMVIQPPRNGQYGANKVVVKILHGYDGNPETYTQRLRDAIAAYVTTMHKKGLVEHIGDNVRRENYSSGKKKGGYEQSAAAAPPPFTLPSRPVDLNQPSGPVNDWPPTPQPLTLQQIMLACPGAPNDFLLQQLTAKPTDLNTVSLAWLMYQQAHQVPEKPAEPPVVVNPTPAPLPTPGGGALLHWLLGSTIVLQIVNMFLPFLRAYVVTTPTKIDDLAESLLEKFLATRQPTSVTVSAKS